jgi:hypothetical protein
MPIRKFKYVYDKDKSKYTPEEIYFNVKIEWGKFTIEL